jgi:hypothetical protein
VTTKRDTQNAFYHGEPWNFLNTKGPLFRHYPHFIEGLPESGAWIRDEVAEAKLDPRGLGG